MALGRRDGGRTAGADCIDSLLSLFSAFALLNLFRVGNCKQTSLEFAYFGMRWDRADWLRER